MYTFKYNLDIKKECNTDCNEETKVEFLGDLHENEIEKIKSELNNDHNSSNISMSSVGNNNISNIGNDNGYVNIHENDLYALLNALMSTPNGKQAIENIFLKNNNINNYSPNNSLNLSLLNQQNNINNYSPNNSVNSYLNELNNIQIDSRIINCKNSKNKGSLKPKIKANNPDNKEYIRIQTHGIKIYNPQTCQYCQIKSQFTTLLLCGKCFKIGYCSRVLFILNLIIYIYTQF